jgi:uncharacterized protein YdhG (YjbR/CyaY superfamily)
MSKYSKEIQDKTRKWVSELFTNATYPDLNEKMRYISRAFARQGESMTLSGLIKTSWNNSAFLPPSGYSHDIDKAYVDCGYAHIMSYEQFIFALPQIWYTTLFRIIQEWEAKCSETDLAY